MTTRSFKTPSFALALVTGALLAACGGNDGSDMSGGSTYTPPGTGTGTGTGYGGAGVGGYLATALVSDTATTALQTDAHLVNAWGLAFNPSGFAWVANAGSSTSTLYDGNGVPQSLVVSIPAGAVAGAKPTGIVFNATSDFTITESGVTGKAAFLFATLEGQIAGWSPTVDGTHAFTIVDNGTAGAVYTGLANGASAGANRLFAADFKLGTVDTFDATFAPVTTPGRFVDPTLPAGYAPFGIQQIGGKVVVTYAQPDPTTKEKFGAGLGLVDVFDTDGNLLTHLVAAGGVLNAPWGVALAPANFGKFSGMLLVGNFGDGTIHAFDPATGALKGTLGDNAGNPFVSPRLWALQFGNGLDSQPTNTLFYTAGPGGTHGVYGRIDLN